MLLLYSFLGYVLLILALPLSPLLAFFPRLRRGFWQRLGFLPKALRKLSWVGEGSVWVHAASLGEVNAIIPVVTELARLCPKETFVFTCTSYSGVNQARAKFPQARAHLILPLDLPLFLEPYLRAFEPKMAVIAETELWPNFISLLKKRRCLVLVANGRMSEKSLRAYGRVRPLFNALVRSVDCFAMQAEPDAKRVLALGAHPQRVQVTGNTKYDTAAQTRVPAAERQALARELGLETDSRLLVAGSTRPGEEALVLEAFVFLRRKQPGLKLLLAPRHLERLAEVTGLLKRQGLEYCLRSKSAEKGAGARIIVLDTQGELARLYAVASLALVGGSFRDFGGQNPLEPAALGVPVVFGPSMRHFQDIAVALLAAGAALKVENPAGLGPALDGLLDDASALKAMGAAGSSEVARRAGASAKCAELAAKLMRIKSFKQDNEQWRVDSATASQKVLEFGVTVEKGDL